MPDKPPNPPPSISAHMMTDRLVYHLLYHCDRSRGRPGYLIDVSSCNNSSDYYIKEVCCAKKILLRVQRCVHHLLQKISYATNDYFSINPFVFSQRHLVFNHQTPTASVSFLPLVRSSSLPLPRWAEIRGTFGKSAAFSRGGCREFAQQHCRGGSQTNRQWLFATQWRCWTTARWGELQKPFPHSNSSTTVSSVKAEAGRQTDRQQKGRFNEPMSNVKSKI